MIIVKLKGGLGNQLFQYAVGRHLAEIHKTKLKMDISLFETYELHAYSIWPFNIQENFASLDEVRAVAPREQGIAERMIRRVLHRPLKTCSTYVQEKHFHFDPDILNLPNGVYLDGYWQSERYFASIAETLRQEFTVKTPIEGKEKEIAEKISQTESVSLHIRRGTYTLHPHSDVHGTCSVDYYIRGASHLTQTVRNPHFFIFSDDPEWTRENLNLPYSTTFVEHNRADKDYEDLRLMSLCKHHIIANSTFSWWGAWLCSYPSKLIVAPRKWFNHAKNNTNDLIPKEWIKF
jgi:hypothetical protein